MGEASPPISVKYIRVSNDKAISYSHISANHNQTVPKESFKTIKSFSGLPAI